MDEKDSQGNETSHAEPLTGEERIRQQIAQLQAKLNRIQAKKQKTERDADNRECQLLGVLTKRYFFPRDPTLKDRYLKAADEYYSRDGDRAVFGLPPRPKKKTPATDAANDAGKLKEDFEKEKA